MEISKLISRFFKVKTLSLGILQKPFGVMVSSPDYTTKAAPAFAETAYQ
jgi:hypothetical protein